MATERKPSQRDATLVKVLERLVDQLRQYDTRLEEITNDVRQNNARLDEMTKKQRELSESVTNVMSRNDSWRVMQQDVTDTTLEKFSETMLHYRSDMVSLVREQDRIDDSIKDLSKRQDMIAAAQEEIGKDVSSLDERFEHQEKTSREHYEYSVKRGEAASKEIEDVNRQTAKHHVDTEKVIGDGHKEIQKQLVEADKKVSKLHLETEKNLGGEHKDIKKEIIELRQETKRRLLALDGIEATLQVLMIRTEPPEKKPFFVIRAGRGVGRFFKFRLPDFFRRIKLRFTK